MQAGMRATAAVYTTARTDPAKLFGKSHGGPVFISKGEQDFGFFEFVKAHAEHMAFCRIACAVDAWKPNSVSIEMAGFRNNATLVTPEAWLRLHRDNVVYVVDTDFPREIMLKPAPYNVNDGSGTRAKRLRDSFGAMLMQVNQFIEYPCAAICDEAGLLAIRRLHSDFEDAHSRSYGQGVEWMGLQEGQGAGLLDELISGKSGLVALKNGTARYIRLIINFCANGCAAAEEIINALRTQYGRTIERHTISRPADAG